MKRLLALIFLVGCGTQNISSSKLELAPQPTPCPTVAPTPEPTPLPTPEPLVKPVQGYDLLGLAKYCSTYIRAPYLPGLSTMLVSFGDPVPCIKLAVEEKKIKHVQVDLIDATCWRNRVCPSGAAKPDDLKEIESKAKIIQGLAIQYPQVDWWVSPALEHDVKESAKVRKMLEAAKKGCPKCSVINSPFSGAVVSGYKTERHGTKVSAFSVSGDGASMFEGDNLKNDGNNFQHRIAGTDYNYAWWNETNLRCTGEKTFVPINKRTVLPELFQFNVAQKIYTTIEDAPPTAPSKCRRVVRISKANKEINKPFAERYCNGQPNEKDVRGNKPLLILKKSAAVGTHHKIYSFSGKEVGCFRYYGPYSEKGLHRWYMGDCSGKNAWDLYKALGNEWGFVDQGNGQCLMFNSLRREGVYR